MKNFIKILHWTQQNGLPNVHSKGKNLIELFEFQYRKQQIKKGNEKNNQTQGGQQQQQKFKKNTSLICINLIKLPIALIFGLYFITDI